MMVMLFSLAYPIIELTEKKGIKVLPPLELSILIAQSALSFQKIIVAFMILLVLIG